MTLIDFVFTKLRTPKTWSDNCLKGRVSEDASTLFKSPSHHLYHIHWSWPSQTTWKKSLLLRWKMLGLLVNTLAADLQKPVLNRDNLTIPIQMQLSQRQKTFLQFFTAFLKCNWNFERFEKKMTLIAFVFSKLRTAKT